MYQNFKKKFFPCEKFSQNFSEFFDDFSKIFFHGLLILLQKFFKSNFGQYSIPENSTCKIKYQKNLMGKIFKNTFEKHIFEVK